MKMILVHFSLFERVAELRGWQDTERTLLLQCVLTGKAQSAYSALSVEDSKQYVKVKDAVLKAYGLVPEAYRQPFRFWKRGEQQTNLEFARDLLNRFNHWFSAAGVVSYKDLSDLIVLEQFKNTLRDHIATYVNEHKVSDVLEAASLVDDYVLTHKSNHGDNLCYFDRGTSAVRGPRKVPLLGVEPVLLLTPPNVVIIAKRWVIGKISVHYFVLKQETTVVVWRL